MNKVDNQVLITDLMLRIAVLETLLLEKNIFTLEQYNVKMNEVTEKIVNQLLQSSGSSQEQIEAFKESMKNSTYEQDLEMLNDLKKEILH